MRFRLAVLTLLLTSAIFGMVACNPLGSSKNQSDSNRVITINGAGSTFIYPALSKWSSVYENVKPKIKVNYQSIGSGGGIRQIIAKTVDFGATDGPMTDKQLLEAKDNVFHIPAVMGAVVPAYHLPNVKKPIKFTGPILAKIFLGEIKNWNDPQIKTINPGVSLPNQPIVTVHRSDGSGTTYIWVDYLSKVSKTWANRVGISTSVNWPTGVGAKGNEGVAGQISQIPGSLGYLELTYVLQNNISYGLVKNKSGNYIKATPETVTIAGAEAANNLPKDLRVSITDPNGSKSYPISGFSWFLVRENQSSKLKGKATVEFIWWAMHEGQKYLKELGYAKLPKKVVDLGSKNLKQVKFNSQTLIR
jgi:phosphate transport system substrate-binding protein